MEPVSGLLMDCSADKATPLTNLCLAFKEIGVLFAGGV